MRSLDVAMNGLKQLLRYLLSNGVNTSRIVDMVNSCLDEHEAIDNTVSGA